MSVESLIDTYGVSCNVTRPTFAPEASGFPVPTFSSHLSAIPVFIQPSSGSEGVRYGRENNRTFLTAYAKAGQDIQAKDRITIVSDSRVFDIQDVRSPGTFPSTNGLAHLEMDLEETQTST